MSDTLWYKDAVFYELYVRAFQDSDGDGIGDLPGITSRLDYLQALGVDAIWLLPISPSPLRDDGYDVSDYCDIHPMYGNLDEFRGLVNEAHRRGLKIVVELVPNHTSDQHPWFQASRDPNHPEHARYRDYYVWSETNERYQDARIIFLDSEQSNWTYDPLRKAYFWHRFFYHQPDLNYDNPEVQRAMLDVVQFWIDQGADGIRVDAPPYLFEREGTSCENLPETHAYLKRLRTFVESYAPGTMLLSEANQWPEDVRPYFGNGDEMHMNFHFPLMPRIFMALAKAERASIVDILTHTPALPEACQWGIFLRCHDELTLEMVTTDERRFMWDFYAPEPRMRLNLGIRRRLAPLLDNDRRKIELANSLLFTLPGSPFVYYGDEIGMGDNIWLDDRTGVRTPMQWDATPSAGFSEAAS
ncbi:MAG: maltose alpha-D-glucosyltransferase, partial [Chloroflexi bacterium RBG_19FT_COMBO_56_12]